MRHTVTLTRGATSTDVLNTLVVSTGITSVVAGVVTYPASTTNGYSLSNGASSCSVVWAGSPQPAAGSKYTVTYQTTEPGLQLRGGDYIKAAFVSALRAAYAAQTWFPLYRYNVNDTLSGLGIHESFPKKPIKAPVIVVKIAPSRMKRTGTPASDFVGEVTTNDVITGYYAWGDIDTEVSVEIYAVTDSDRRKLTDITALFMRHLFTRLFAKYGIGYNNIRTTGEQEVEWQSQLLYTNSIHVDCHTEWQVEYPVELVEIIDNLSVS